MSLFKIIFFVPESHLEQVKQAMFDAGAGKLGHYDMCAWQVKGEGQFRPLKGSHAFIGQKDTLEKIEEYRVEMIAAKESVKQVVNSMKRAHPYEEPAYEVYETVNIDLL